MVRGARVRRPEAAADRPEPWMLITIALGSLAAGLSVARGLTRDSLEPANTDETQAFRVAQIAPTTVAAPASTPSVPRADAQPLMPRSAQANTAESPPTPEAQTMQADTAESPPTAAALSAPATAP